MRFDCFLQGLPAGIQLFSLLQSNPKLLSMLVLIMGSAPRLSAMITQNPHIFDGMLDPNFGSNMALGARLGLFLAAAVDYEERLDRLRVFANEQRFLIGLQLLYGLMDARQASIAFTELAELLLQTSLRVVEEEFANQHGQIPGGKVAILAMGRLGSRELMASSDLDIILIYTHRDDEATMSDGAKPLYAAQYYMRLTQRLVAALSAHMSDGVLYAVDMRLRPSGKKGPLAVALPAFLKYQQNEAWLWEHLALTRSRPVAGDAELCQRLRLEIRDIIGRSRSHADLVAEVKKVRDLLASEKPAQNFWDLKYSPGGVMDLEFLAQFSILSQHVEYKMGETTVEVLQRLHRANEVLAQLIPADAHAQDLTLDKIYVFYTNIMQVLHVCLESWREFDDNLPDLAKILTRAADVPDLAHLRETLKLYRHYAQAVCEIMLR